MKDILCQGYEPKPTQQVQGARTGIITMIARTVPGQVLLL